MTLSPCSPRMERRGALEEDSRIAAHITLDLQDKRPALPLCEGTLLGEDLRS